jgi:hypothetical protein
MKTRFILALAAPLAAGVAISMPASAQQRVDTVEYTGPDRSLLRSGALTLGLSYVPAAIVGISSPLPADRYLLAPVAGPWIDYAKRDCSDCRNEGLNKVLLAADGVFQGLGALQVLGSFLFVEHTVVTRPAPGDQPKNALNLRVVPKRIAGGYALTASGNF